jgi:hypothetical protein
MNCAVKGIEAVRMIKRATFTTRQTVSRVKSVF